MLTTLFPLILPEVFADSFVVDFDKQQYHRGDYLTISGEILDFRMPVIAPIDLCRQVWPQLDRQVRVSVLELCQTLVNSVRSYALGSNFL